MNNKQQQTANNDQTLWSLLPNDDDVSVSLPYNGSSGWSGTDTSQERAYIADIKGDTKAVQSYIMKLLYVRDAQGATWSEIADLTLWHHGTVSGALSVLHKEERIARLKERRGKSRVYVLPEYVNGRDTDKQGRKHECPECGHRF